MSLVSVTTRNDIGFITMRHERKKNALSEPLILDIVSALASFREQRIRVAILRAQPGTAVWSAGHDVTELPESGRDPLEWQDPLRYLVREIETFPAPIIAMIEGTVWGGACEAAFACDLIVAAPNVTFAVTPAKLGVPYNVSGIVTFMNAASLRIMKEMAFTAQPMGAERAERLGIINYIVPNDELEAFTVRLAHQMLANAPLSISVMKEQMRILAGARPMSPRGFERIQSLRRVVYSSDDYQEGIRAFNEKRKPVYNGK